jgi:hypothetical protein
MKRLHQWLALASVTLALCVSAGQAQAQGRGQGGGNFDPEEWRQRMMERYKEALEVKNDAEWKIIEDRLNKVMEARREVGFGFGGRGMMGGGGRRGGGPGADANPEAEALQKALEAKASTEEIKTALAKYREARKTKEAALAKAREELKKVLSVRQEATMVMMGLLE